MFVVCALLPILPILHVEPVHVESLGPNRHLRRMSAIVRCVPTVKACGSCQKEPHMSSRCTSPANRPLANAECLQAGLISRLQKSRLSISSKTPGTALSQACSFQSQSLQQLGILYEASSPCTQPLNTQHCCHCHPPTRRRLQQPYSALAHHRQPRPNRCFHFQSRQVHCSH